MTEIQYSCNSVLLRMIIEVVHYCNIVTIFPGLLGRQLHRSLHFCKRSY